MSLYTEVTTTIRTRIDLDTMTPDHSVEISAGEGIPAQVARAAAIGGCKATIRTLEKDRPTFEDEADDDEDDEA